MKVAVYCGSSEGPTESEYMQAAYDLGQTLAAQGIELVYGGASVGLMGATADGALDAGGKVTGVMPDVLVDKELAHPHLTDLKQVRDMHHRKAIMSELADGFIAMPGGTGTLEELFEVWCWAQLGIHHKPCALYNVSGFYNKLLEFIQHAENQQFIREEYSRMLVVENSAEKILQAFKAYQPPADKWRDRSVLKPVVENV
ncbi:MAG: TIGR00730 family Rossman fold protein [Oceanospirillaceae bacterium]|nr:TIGR00730 family Rossman fold protein [Oceanospirillaceae bacterium]